MLVQGGSRVTGSELSNCGFVQAGASAHTHREEGSGGGAQTYGRVAKATDCWWPAATEWLVVRTTDAVVVRPIWKQEVVTAMWTRQNCGVRGQIRNTAAPSRPGPTGARRLGR